MFRAGRAVLVFLAVAILARCENVLAFQQKIPVPVHTILRLVASKDTRSSPLVASERHSFQETTRTKQYHSNDDHGTSEFGSDIDCDGDGDTVGSCVFSRRKAVSGALSLATITSWWPLTEAFASSDEETIPKAAQQPFRVLFMIQIDSQKPDDLSELEIEVRPDWAPLAAERFRNLVELGFYRDAPFFRVLPGYVAQFGVSSDPKLNQQWVYCDTNDEDAKRNCRPSLPDEPRTQPNKKGTLSFASSGKNSRKTQIFINLANNDGPPNFLDAQNFVPFARIVGGMEPENNIPKRLNGEYGGKVNQGKAAYYGGEYFKAVFPKLSVIRDAKIL